MVESSTEEQKMLAPKLTWEQVAEWLREQALKAQYDWDELAKEEHVLRERRMSAEAHSNSLWSIVGFANGMAKEKK